MAHRIVAALLCVFLAAAAHADFTGDIGGGTGGSGSSAVDRVLFHAVLNTGGDAEVERTFAVVETLPPSSRIPIFRSAPETPRSATRGPLASSRR